MTCRDSFLFLESEYQFIDALLSLQADCNMADSSDVETLAPPQATPTSLKWYNFWIYLKLLSLWMYIFRDFYPLPNCLLPLSLWISPIVVIYSSSMLAPWSGIVFLSPVTLLEDRMRGAYPHTTSQRQDSSLNYRDFLTYSLSLSPSPPPPLPPPPPSPPPNLNPSPPYPSPKMTERLWTLIQKFENWVSVKTQFLSFCEKKWAE